MGTARCPHSLRGRPPLKPSTPEGSPRSQVLAAPQLPPRCPPPPLTAPHSVPQPRAPLPLRTPCSRHMLACSTTQVGALGELGGTGKALHGTGSWVGTSWH